MAGPKKNQAAGWTLLRSGLSIEPEAAVTSSGAAYLGCKEERTESRLNGGQLATVVGKLLAGFVVDTRGAAAFAEALWLIGLCLFLGTAALSSAWRRASEWPSEPNPLPPSAPSSRSS